ncbi:conserved hypothetical protein [Histoplasma capsulatum var. duboisii H88]|uniref:Uncharacterized protein n=1 Tax=Ajellomyces capsulatus (strain H88) TaxID=544711 RepID=F0UI60_AJEC8|nr:conserved hypothetical protein [Histoplasma capsulatum var. duboisii H88]
MSGRFNTQSSSQCQFPAFVLPPSKVPFSASLPSLPTARRSSTMQPETRAEKGIVGRGILLDFHKWASENHIHADIFEKNFDSAETSQGRVAESQGTEIKFGDILIIRVVSHCAKLKSKMTRIHEGV